MVSAAGIFDPADRTVHRPGFVEVAGSTIAYVGAVPPPTGRHTTRIELDGQYLLPGLIDSHVHLCFDPTSSDCVSVLQAQSDSELLAAMAERGRQAARAGVTTVRDLGDRNYLAARLARTQDARLPTILSAGPPLTSPAGHCHYLGGEVASAAQAVDAVNRHCDNGVDLIKIMVTGGILTENSDPGFLQFDASTVHAAVRQAHARGRRVAAHAHTRQGIELALRAGVDTIEHATFASEDTFDFDPELAAEIARSNCWVCPTYVARPGLEWQTEHFAWRTSVLARLHQAGVRLAAGTDAGVKQGLSHSSAGWVFASLVGAGLSTVEALVSVTLGAAHACGVQDRKGRLLAGMDADLVAVRTDPLTNPLALTAPSLVMCRGTLLHQPD